MDGQAEVVVIGAGLAGLGVAWRLAQRGRRVVVLEAGAVGRGASHAAAGMLAPSAEIGFQELDLYALGRESLRRWPAFARDLEAASGVEVGYRADGTLVVADDRDSARALRRLFAFQTEHAAPVEWLSGEQACDLEPLLSPRLPAAIWARDDHHVDPRAVVAALDRAARLAGVEIRERARVAHLGAEAGGAVAGGTASGGAVAGGAVAGGTAAGRVEVVLDGGERIAASAVVVAAGVWSRAVGGLVPGLPVRQVKGQALALRMAPERGVELGHVVRGPDAYLVPRHDGRLVVGATSEDGVTDHRVTAGGVYRLLEGAVAMVPAVEELELVETWASHRPAPLDHAPLLGQIQPGVFAATGHYRHGVLLAPVTADEVAAEVDRALGGAPETAPVLAPFSPLRFD